MEHPDDQNTFNSHLKVTPDVQQLREYNMRKLELGKLLGITKEALTYLGFENAANSYKDLIVKLAEDHFTLAVLGQFKRGKSSLMNAILGRNYLPTGVVPLTSVVTILQYGPKENLRLNYKGHHLDIDHPVDDLDFYVTERGNPGNEKHIDTATLELPVPFLKQGLHFVDTPGIGSVISANTQTTYTFLPQCDAALFVTGIDTPFSQTEMDFLIDLSNYVEHIFLVINKIDLLVQEGQHDEIQQFITRKIQEKLPAFPITIYPVSAKMALQSKLENDDQLYEKSGLKSLEESLGQYLSEEKYNNLLTSVAKKALETIHTLIENEVLNDAYIKERVEILTSDNSQYIPDLYKLRDGILQTPERLENMLKEKEIHPSLSPSQSITTPMKLHIKPSENNKKSQYHCPVCHHLEQVTFDFLAHFQYDFATDEKLQSQFAKEWGFCPHHNWQLANISSRQGISNGLHKLALELSDFLNAYRKGLDTSSQNPELLTEKLHSCRLCDRLDEEEELYLQKLIQQMGHQNWRSEYEQSTGFCIKHLAALLKRNPSKEICQFLLEHSITHLNEEATDMLSYVLKRNAIRNGEINSDEENAWKHTLERIAGIKKIS